MKSRVPSSRAVLVVSMLAFAGCATAEDVGGGAEGGLVDSGSVRPDTGLDASAHDTDPAPDTSVDSNLVDSNLVDSSPSDTTPVDAGPLDGDTCATATAVTLDATGHASLGGQTTNGYAEDHLASGTSCLAVGAADHAYAVPVPAGRKLTVTVSPTDANFDPALNLVLGPASNCGPTGACVTSGVDAASSGSPETIAWFNATGADATVFVIVDSAQSNGTSQGTYVVDVGVAPIPPGDTCGNAVPVTITGTTATAMSSETLTGYAQDLPAGTGCGTSNGPDHLYKIDIPAGQRLSATVTPSAFDAVLAIQPDASCASASRTCLVKADAGGSGVAETITYANTGSSTLTVDLVVASYSSTTFGNYSLSAALQPLPPNDTCAAPIAVAAPGSVTGDTTAASDDYSSGTGCLGGAGPDLVYSVDVPAGKQLAATIVSTGSGFVPTLDLVDPSQCAPGAALVCFAGGATTSSSPGATVRWTNAATSTKHVLMIVDSASTGGPFQLSTALADPPAGDTCANPFALATDGSLKTGDTSGATNDYGAGAGCGGAAGPDQVYTVTIPPLQLLTTTAFGSGSFVPSISYQTGLQCSSAPRVCSGGADAASASSPIAIRYANESSTTSETIDVVVDSSSTSGGGYTIDALLSATQPGDLCGTATPIIAGAAALAATTTGFSNDYEGGLGCKPTTGPDRVFSVTVPAGKELTAVVSPSASFDPTLSLVAGTPGDCAAHQCNAAVDANPAGQPEVAHYVNAAGADQTVFILVDSESATNASGDFSLSATIGDPPANPPPGDTCYDAPTLIAGAAAIALSGDVSTYTDDYTYPGAASCQYHSGPDVVYSVGIPAGKTLTATVTNTLGDTFYVNLVTGTAASCGTNLPCVTNAASSTAATITYTNATGAAQTGFVIIDSLSATGPYSMSLTVN